MEERGDCICRYGADIQSELRCFAHGAKNIFGKPKRSLNKAARGEHEAIVARAPPSGQEAANDGSAADACKAPALAQLDDPTTLEYLREYFEFLASQKLFYCKVCDEEWPVFDKEWPQSGVRTAGELAGVCETIKCAGFQADAKKKE